MEEYRYTYFVSFAHDRGFGNVEVIVEEKLDSLKKINHIKETLESEKNSGEYVNITILNVVMLRKTKIVGKNNSSQKNENYYSHNEIFD